MSPLRVYELVTRGDMTPEEGARRLAAARRPQWWHSDVVVLGLGILALLGLILVQLGCASGIDGARQALTAAERVQTQAIHAFESFDDVYQTKIARDALASGKPEEGKAQLLAYRLKRGAVTKVLLDAAALTAIGKTLIPLVESGARKSTDLTAWIGQLLEMGNKVREALHTFGVEVP